MVKETICDFGLGARHKFDFRHWQVQTITYKGQALGLWLESCLVHKINRVFYGPRATHQKGVSCRVWVGFKLVRPIKF